MTGPRVLLVDDNAEVAWGLGRCLTRAGFAVTACGDGTEALPLLEARPFDVLVTDIQLPQLNGLALIDWVRAHRPATRVIVMTAFGSPHVRQVTMGKGAVLYLEKPVDPQLIIDLLQHADAQDTFAGSVSAIDLLDYVQLLLLTRRQVVLEVCSSAGARGTIFIDRGAVPHAECGERAGEPAFFHLLGFAGGTFATMPWREPPCTSITTRGDFLLMEAARVKDEAARPPVAASAPPAAEPAVADFDLAFEDAFAAAAADAEK